METGSAYSLLLPTKYHQMQSVAGYKLGGLDTTKPGCSTKPTICSSGQCGVACSSSPGCKEEVFTTTPRPSVRRPTCSSPPSSPLPFPPPPDSEPKGCAAGCQVPSASTSSVLLNAHRSFVPYLSFSDPPFLRTLASCCSISAIHATRHFSFWMCTVLNAS